MQVSHCGGEKSREKISRCLFDSGAATLRVEQYPVSRQRPVYFEGSDHMRLFPTAL